MSADKIKTLDELCAILEGRRGDGQTVVQCHGVFDLLHIGHIKHLEEARRLGDVLVVTVTPDAYVDKGPHRPAFPERLRLEALAALGCVDYVTSSGAPTAVDAIRRLRPHVYVKGAVQDAGKRDHTDAIRDEEAAVQAAGGRLALTDTELSCASSLINRHLDVFTPEAKAFLDRFRRTHDAQGIVDTLQGLRELKVLAVGETILDEYHFCDVLDKANKDPILAAKFNYAQCYAGGILAIANHLAGFCAEVGVLTFLGADESREEFVRSALDERVRARFLYKTDSPTIVKRRFLEEYLAQKLFEVYLINDDPLTDDDEAALCAALEDLVPRYDVVVLADYGHAMFTPRAVRLVCDRARFLAVNAQVNAGNRGFNFVTKYPRADYVSIDVPEARLEVRDPRAGLEEVVRVLAGRMDCPRFLVTQGKAGCLCYDRQAGFCQVPAFAIRTVDRIGAGDAVLALSAPCVARGAPMEEVGFIANVVGAEACAILGNERAIDPVSLLRHVTSLLK